MSDARSIQPTRERLMFLRSRLACKRPRRTTLFVVPWINIALLLFAVHIVHSQRLLSPGIALSLPIAPFTGGAPLGSEVVTILRNGSVFYRDEHIPLSNLTDALKQSRSRGMLAPAAGRAGNVRIATGQSVVNENPTLLIEADVAVTHGQLAAVYNAAQAAGYRDVVLATRLPDGGADGAANGR